MNTILSKLWETYIQENPNAKQVYQLFADKGEKVVNDHIALRTFDHPRVDINVVEGFFLKYGYVRKGDYHFEEKKLYARHYEHPSADYPKIFISQLLCHHFSEKFQKVIREICDAIPDSHLQQDAFIYSGIPWGEISHKTYEKLREESEYAAWLYANGFVANHFTVSVNQLKHFKNLVEVNQFIKENSFEINANPNEIQGSKEQFLEQSSIKAGLRKQDFKEGVFEIPACYYEFALRYPESNGELFQGFIAKSADKIFESTDFYQKH